MSGNDYGWTARYTTHNEMVAAWSPIKQRIWSETPPCVDRRDFLLVMDAIESAGLRISELLVNSAQPQDQP